MILQILQLNQNGTLSGLPGKNNVELIVIEYYPHAASLIKKKTHIKNMYQSPRTLFSLRMSPAWRITAKYGLFNYFILYPNIDNNSLNKIHLRQCASTHISYNLQAKKLFFEFWINVLNDSKYQHSDSFCRKCFLAC